LVQEACDEEANIIFGAVINENLGDELRITVIATGFEEGQDTTLNIIDKKEKKEEVKETVKEEKVNTSVDPDLDIPTFLRRR
jgi:cell division protein FtsZ